MFTTRHYHRVVALLRALVGSLWMDRSARGLATTRAWVCLAALAATSCAWSADDDSLAPAHVGKVAQAITDTDGDGMDDAWETSFFGSLSQTASGDFDSDDMTNLEEFLYSFNPTVKDSLDDADGDRYPNIFELRGSSDPNSSSSVPSPTYTVNGAGGGTHTTIGAAISSATTTNGAYQIIAIAAGTYTGTSNYNVSIASTKPKLLFIGLDGAAKTIIDGGNGNWGWTVSNTAVIASLTFQKTWQAFWIDAASKDVRLVDLIVRDNGTTSSYAAGAHINNAARVSIIGSTFLDNAGMSSAKQIYFAAGTNTVVNTVVYASGTGTMLAKGASATMTTNYCLVKGQTLSGTGNLSGSTDPKFLPDLHVKYDSPLRAAGGTVAQSRIDIDGELRPSSAPDIGVDQFVDSDADDLADRWEQVETGGLTTLTSRTQDADSDGLNNDQEYVAGLKPSVADTDGDGLSDGAEVSTHTTDPLKPDTDGDDMPDGWEVTYGLSPLTANGLDDADGDRYPNAFEYAGGTDPTSASSIPTATYTVNGAGGGTHTTIGAAITSATTTNGAYQIIAIAPGTYTGSSNHNVTIASTKPKLLFIGTDGAAKTVIDGGNTYWGWNVYNTSVIASLTFQKTWQALWIDAPSKEVRLVDLVVRDNGTTSSYAAGVHVNSAAKVNIVGSTFLDNAGMSSAKQIYFAAGTNTVVNTVVYASGTGTLLAKGASATMTTNYCLVKGQTLTGTGNLAGTTDPKFWYDVHVRWDSPLRAAGGTSGQSRIDIDGETRPSSAPDIGVDQFVDSDSDELPDNWEQAKTGGLTTLTGRSQDADSDGLTNEQEFFAGTQPNVADTDGDGLSDGAEGTNSTDPLKADTDGDDMPDGWEVTYGLSPTTANAYDDADGDRYPNIFEYARSTNPSSASSVPTANYVVNGAGGGTHTTISGALSAANVANGAYQVIAIAAGTYTGSSNVTALNFAATKPKLLVIGLDGASKTIIEGDGGWGWYLHGGAVISSLTFQKTSTALWISAGTNEVRLIDLVVRDNTTTGSYAAGVHVDAAAKVQIVGSTFLDNTGMSTAKQIYIGAGLGTLTNTVVWGQATGTMLAKATSATLTTNYDLVKGQTLTGMGNLAGTVDPKLRSSDIHLLYDSPLRSAGASTGQSRIDVDGELRPSSTPDIGVDQFVDSDGDQLADRWEQAETGGLTTLTSRTQDADGDGLTNDQEYVAGTKPSVVDTDGDGLSDGDELSVHGTSPFVTDTDGDDMPDAWEVSYGLSPTVANGFEDADGDRYPNAFEYAHSTNPANASSKPTPTYVVNAAGGGTHTTVAAAVTAANVQNTAYQIIGIAPGVYTGTDNVYTPTFSRPKMLVIGLDGAAKTIIDGATNGYGWTVTNSAVIASLTFKRTWLAVYVNAPSSQVRLVDLLVQENKPGLQVSNSWAAGVHVNAASRVDIAGSTFLNNKGLESAEQIYIGAGAATIANTVVWSTGSNPVLAKATAATLSTTYSLARGQTLSGTGNLAGTVDPKLRSDGRLRSDSPLRAAGGTIAQSRYDMDGEQRPSTLPDIGADQFLDADSDGLPDAWEVVAFGNTTSVSGAADNDNDDLNNVGEYDWETDRLNPDTDGDGAIDGIEVAHGMNPLVADADDVTTDLNGDGLIDSLGYQLGFPSNHSDSDGDGVSNAQEALMCTDPFRADTDGDGIPDDADPFPHDPLMSSLPSNSSDVTAPQITLTAPWYAVEQ